MISSIFIISRCQHRPEWMNSLVRLARSAGGKWRSFCEAEWWGAGEWEQIFWNHHRTSCLGFLRCLTVCKGVNNMCIRVYIYIYTCISPWLMFKSLIGYLIACDSTIIYHALYTLWKLWEYHWYLIGWWLVRGLYQPINVLGMIGKIMFWTVLDQPGLNEMTGSFEHCWIWKKQASKPSENGRSAWKLWGLRSDNPIGDYFLKSYDNPQMTHVFASLRPLFGVSGIIGFADWGQTFSHTTTFWRNVPGLPQRIPCETAKQRELHWVAKPANWTLL